MTVEEIYAELAEHMLQGMMTHEQFANYYQFLGLDGYSKCHEYHFYEESCNYRELCSYYISRENKLIPEINFTNVSVIPSNWHRYSRQEVDNGTRRSAVKDGLEKWVQWEFSTKKLYEAKFKELYDMGEISHAMKIKALIKDVDKELENANHYLLCKQIADFDISTILSEQKEKKEKYENKIRCMKY